jgi:hypothetical protein
MARIAMIASLIVIITLIVDSLIQILIYLRVGYTSQVVENGDGVQVHESNLQIQYQQNQQTNNINFLMPIYPFFLDCFCKIQISFEGSPIVPRLYTNAKNKHLFVSNLNRAVIFLGVIQFIFGTLCVYSYGNKLQEIILLNLTYGTFSNFIKLLYTGGMMINLVMQLIPILEIVESRQTSVFNNHTVFNEVKQDASGQTDIYVYDPNQLTWYQRMVRFGNQLFLISFFLLLTMALQDFNLLLLIDGAILSNVLVIMLPNAFYLYQVHYGYLKYHETHTNYLIGCLMFYLSIFNVIYVTFRGV